MDYFTKMRGDNHNIISHTYKNENTHLFSVINFPADINIISPIVFQLWPNLI